MWPSMRNKDNKDRGHKALGKTGTEKGNAHGERTEMMADNFKPGLLHFCKGWHGVLGGGYWHSFPLPMEWDTWVTGTPYCCTEFLKPSVPQILPLSSWPDLKWKVFSSYVEKTKITKEPDDTYLLSSMPSGTSSPVREMETSVSNGSRGFAMIAPFL